MSLTSIFQSPSIIIRKVTLIQRVHSEIEKFYLLDGEEDHDDYLDKRINEAKCEKTKLFLKNVKPLLLNETEMKLNVKELEYPVKHSILPIYGIVDCIAYIDGFGWTVIGTGFH